jgi:hypothetical protein
MIRIKIYELAICALKIASWISIFSFIILSLCSTFPSGDEMKWKSPLNIDNKSSKKLDVVYYRLKSQYQEEKLDISTLDPQTLSHLAFFYSNYFCERKTIVNLRIYRDFHSTHQPYTIIIPEEKRWRNNNADY